MGEVTVGRMSIKPPEGLPKCEPLVVPGDGHYMLDMDFSEIEKRVELSLNEQAIKAHREKFKNAAVEQGLTECQSCGACCINAPCKLKLFNIPSLAHKFGLTPEELFKKYLTIDKHEGMYFVIPIRKGQEDIAGMYLPDIRTRDIGECIFLTKEEDKYLCSIHDIKPSEGAAYKCWELAKAPDSEYAWEKDFIMMLGWDGTEDEVGFSDIIDNLL